MPYQLPGPVALKDDCRFISAPGVCSTVTYYDKLLEYLTYNLLISKRQVGAVLPNTGEVTTTGTVPRNHNMIHPERGDSHHASIPTLGPRLPYQFWTEVPGYGATLAIEGKPYHISIFDTAGQEDFNKLRVLAYMKCDVFLICFSVAQPETLKSVQENWVPELRQYLPETPFVLVGTQTDRRTNALSSQVVHGSFVSAKEGAEMASKLGACYYVECSSLTGEGLDDLKQDIVYTAQKSWETNCTNQTKCCNCEII
ncbi:hypothetical protein ScPMuIL_014622 [Solemya velum]